MHCIKVHPLLDNTGYFLITAKSTSNLANICKYLFSIPSSVGCREIPSMSMYTYGQLMLSAETFFFVGLDPNNFNLHFYKAGFGGNSIVWGNKINWNLALWSVSYSESLISEDSSKIYSFVSFGGTPLNMYFTTFSAIGGNVVGNRYKSNIAWGAVYGSTLNDEYIIITASCTPFDQLIVYSTVTSIFSTKQFSNSLYQTIVDPNSKR